MNPLWTPMQAGALCLPHRVVMAPMTRSRSQQPGNVPPQSMATYYAQRASAAFIVSEATQITPQGQGYSFTPGIHSAEQVAGWRRVTDAVHAAGGRMVLQLWHVGRMSHPMFQQGQATVAPSALAPNAQVWIVDERGQGGMVDCPVPRALTVSEIRAIVNDYSTAAANALAAGVDGVEIHAANGYLIDSFSALRFQPADGRLWGFDREAPALSGRGDRRGGRRGGCGARGCAPLATRHPAGNALP